jgi:hypothetical protein
VSSRFEDHSVPGCGGGSSPVSVDAAGVNGSFMKQGANGNAGGKHPAGTTWRNEMNVTYLTLVLKILAILELIIKALVIILTR